jgi:hypothetical protein
MLLLSNFPPLPLIVPKDYESQGLPTSSMQRNTYDLDLVSYLLCDWLERWYVMHTGKSESMGADL